MFTQRPIKQAKTIDNVYGSAYYHLEAKDRTISLPATVIIITGERALRP